MAPWLKPAAAPSRPRARQGLTEAERALWQIYTSRAQVAPLPGKALTPPPAPPPPAAAIPVPASPAGPTPPKPRPALLHRGVELQIGHAPPGLDNKRWKALRRGDMQPERTLDLHGRRVQDAHGAVRRFLHEAQADGIRCVAIVTGKGSAGQEIGVLRRELPHWLNAPELRHLLLGAAHYSAGNPGAVVLLLRRPRGPKR